MSSKSDQETIKCKSTTKDGLGDIVQGGTDRHWFEPVLLDLQIPKDPAEEHLEAVGYSAALDLNVEFHCEAFRLTERPERVYVTGSENKKTYCFWFKNGRGTGEFDIEHGCLTLLDTYGCDFSISGRQLLISPHEPGGERMRWGDPNYNGPHNSNELLMSAVDTKR